MELEEVLHFYLGSEVQFDYITLSDDPAKRIEKRKGIFTGILQGEALMQMPWGTQRANITTVKPILRPLSDMTEQEYNAMWELLGWNERITGNRRAEEIIREFAPIEIDDEQINNAHWGYFIKIMPYMLSRGFDLFDLINSNQAIDKTKGE